MFFIGIIFLINLVVYHTTSKPLSTNWEIYYYVNQNLLIISYFFQSSFTTKVLLYKNYNYLIMWFFLYDTINRLSYINKPYTQYRLIATPIEDIITLLATGVICYIIFKIKLEK